VILIGSSGDCNPIWRGSIEALERMAQTISDAVLANLPQPEPLTTLRIASDRVILDLRDIPEPEHAAHMAHEAMTNWEVDTQAWLDHVTGLHRQGQRELNCKVELQLLQMNAGVIAGLPMEPFADYALNLARQTGSDLFYFTGYTNGYIGYLPTATEMLYGGYEINWMPVIYGLLTGYVMPVRGAAELHVLDAVLNIAR
jgi:hypothetical protein